MRHACLLVVVGTVLSVSVTDALSPSGVYAESSAQNAISFARDPLNVDGSGYEDLGVPGLKLFGPFYFLGQISAKASVAAIAADEIDAGLAAAGATVAVGYTAVMILNSSLVSSSVSQATLDEAQNLVANASNATSQSNASDIATASLIGQAAYGSSQILKGLNDTAGRPNNHAVFRQALSLALSPLGVSGIKVDSFVKNQVSAGANPGVAIAYIDCFVQQVRAALAIYSGNGDEAIELQYNASRATNDALKRYLSGSLSSKNATMSPALLTDFTTLVSIVNVVNLAQAAGSDSGVDSLESSVDAFDDTITGATEAIENES